MDFKKKRWIFIVLTAISYSAVWTFPYMIETYYIPVQQAFGFTNEQIGTMMSMFGIVSAIMYFPGGIFADRFSLKTLLSLAFLGTGLLGAITLMIPPLPVMMAVQFGYGLTLVLALWAAIIKFIRMVGNEDEQGKLYGWFFAFSGAAGALMGFGATALYDRLGQSVFAFKALVLFYILCTVLPALIFLITFKTAEAFPDTGSDDKINLKDIKKIIKMPIVWIMIVVVYASFIPKSTMTYFQGYLETYYAVPITLISVIAIIRVQGIRLVVSPASGWLTDKLHASSKTLMIGFIIGIVGGGILMLTPRTQGLAWLIILALFMYATLYNIGMSNYFIPISEAGIPAKYTGTITGFVSVIGFSSDIFYYNFAGGLIDANPDTGYTTIFAISLICCVVGFIFSLFLRKSIKTTRERKILD